MNSNVATTIESSGNIDNSINELIKLAKLGEKVDGLSTGIAETIENDRKSMPVTIFDKYKENIILSVEPSIMKQDVRTHLFENYDDEKYRKIINFLNKPEIISMSQGDNTPITTDTMKDMQHFFANLQQSPMMKTRKGLIEQLDKVKNSSAIFIDSQVALFRSITFGMRDVKHNGQKATDDQLNQLVQEMRTQATPNMERHVWMGMLYTLRNQSDEEVKEYIFLHEAADGKLAIEVTQSAFGWMYKQMTERLQHRLETAFNEKIVTEGSSVS